MAKRVLVSWSSGKDAAWVLHLLRSSVAYEPVGLLTTVVEREGGVCTHGVPVPLVELQAAAAGLPLIKVELPRDCPNRLYEDIMRRELERASQALVFSAVAFGDLYLQDVRRYRERLLEPLCLEAVFPLWAMETRLLGDRMVEAGLEARIVRLDLERVPEEWLGASYEDLLETLPPGVDPCGESGEFHTFVFSGPMFARDIPHRIIGAHREDSFALCDLEAVA